jgi:mycothiol synthase
MSERKRLESEALPPAELSDSVVRLRPLAPCDAADMVTATRAEPDAYVAWGPVAGPIDERRALAFVREYESGRLRGQKMAFAALDAEGLFVGSVLLMSSGPDEAELAYWVRSEARGRGHATRALTLLSDWALGLRFRRFWLEIEPHNAASIAVAVKAGFRATERRLCGIGGAQVECQIFVRAAAPLQGRSAAGHAEAGDQDEQAGHDLAGHAGLPAGYSVRRPTLADLDDVVALITAAESLDRGEPHTTPGDVLADWQGLPHFDLGTDAWLVASASGQIVAYAWEWDERVHEQLVADFTVLPGHRNLGIEDVLLHLAEARAAEHALLSAGGSAALGVFSIDTYRGKLTLFADHGFAQIRTFEHMAIDLDRVHAEPVWPSGITVKPFRLGRDEAAVHDAVQAAFSEHFRDAPLSLSDWKRLVFANPELDLDLWHVAWSSDDVAGSVRSFASRPPDRGFVDELGVRPEWRGRGLGTALLLHSFNALGARGMHRAALGVDAANTTRAHMLYRRLGMSVEYRIRFFEKPIRPAAPPPHR